MEAGLSSLAAPIRSLMHRSESTGDLFLTHALELDVMQSGLLAQLERACLGSPEQQSPPPVTPQLSGHKRMLVDSEQLHPGEVSPDVKRVARTDSFPIDEKRHAAARLMLQRSHSR